MLVHFVLIGEGTSDDGLIPHLERLCIEAGADEVTGAALDFRRLRDPPGHGIENRLRAITTLEPNANLIFIHRDADSVDPAPRYAETEMAAAACGLETRWVAVVPIQETEAWLLLNEDAIRKVAGKPRGRLPLNLPRPQHVEQAARPKERLQQALLTASETTGRKREKFLQDFPVHRRLLLQRLPTGGALEHLSAWMRLREDLQTAIAALRAG